MTRLLYRGFYNSHYGPGTWARPDQQYRNKGKPFFYEEYVFEKYYAHLGCLPKNSFKTYLNAERELGKTDWGRGL